MSTLNQQTPNEEPEELLISDQDYLIREYRNIIKTLEAVKAGMVPIDELEIMIDSYVQFKLPRKYVDGFITGKEDLEKEFKPFFDAELESIALKYQSEERRRRENTRILNEMKFNMLLRNIEEIKHVLEVSGLMNNFASIKIGTHRLPRIAPDESSHK